MTVSIRSNLFGKRWSGTNDTYPFCQNENARSCRDFAQVTGIIDDSGRAIQA